jgi:hypothetical protein
MSALGRFSRRETLSGDHGDLPADQARRREPLLFLVDRDNLGNQAEKERWARSV